MKGRVRTEVYHVTLNAIQSVEKIIARRVDGQMHLGRNVAKDTVQDYTTDYHYKYGQDDVIVVKRVEISIAHGCDNGHNKVDSEIVEVNRPRLLIISKQCIGSAKV